MNNLTFLDIKNNKEYSKNAIKLYNEAFPEDERIQFGYKSRAERTRVW